MQCIARIRVRSGNYADETTIRMSQNTGVVLACIDAVEIFDLRRICLRKALRFICQFLVIRIAKQLRDLISFAVFRNQMFRILYEILYALRLLIRHRGHRVNSVLFHAVGIHLHTPRNQRRSGSTRCNEHDSGFFLHVIKHLPIRFPAVFRPAVIPIYLS